MSALAIGCCAGASDLALLDTTLGLDFIELPVAQALMGSADDFEQLVTQLHRSKLIARAANVLLPATLKVVGPEARPDELSDYASTVLDDVGDVIAHAHVAAAERRAPGQAGDRIEEFLTRLRHAGFAGACSIECRWLDLPAELPAAVARVRQAAAAAGW